MDAEQKKGGRMADFPIVQGDCQNPEEVRRNHFEALVFLVDQVRHIGPTLASIEGVVRGLPDLGVQLKALCAKIEDLAADRKNLGEWRRIVDSELHDHKKDLDAIHEWKREHIECLNELDLTGLRHTVSDLDQWKAQHDIRVEKAGDRAWELKKLLLSPAAGWIVALFLGAAGLGLMLMAHPGNVRVPLPAKGSFDPLGEPKR